MSLYEKYVLPKFLNCACGSKPVSYQRKKVVPHAEGKILEIGIGSGLNIPFYNKREINKVYGLDPSAELCEMAIKTAKDNQIDVNILINGAEEIKLVRKELGWNSKAFQIHKNILTISL